MKLKIFLNNLRKFSPQKEEKIPRIDNITIGSFYTESNIINNNNQGNKEYLKKKYFVFNKTYNSPFSKEWKNSIYYYNKNIMKMHNIINNLNINKLIRDYFLLSFKSDRFINVKHVINKKKPFLLKNIFLSKADIKYTNSKVIVRLFSFNAQRKYVFLKRFTLLSTYIRKNILKKFLKKLKKRIFFIKSKMLKRKTLFKGNKELNVIKFINNREILLLKYKLLSDIIISLDMYIRIHFYMLKQSQKIFFLLFSKLRKYKYLSILNKYKFEKTKLLPILTRLLNNYINKKIEYNIINLKSIEYSPDIFTNVINFKIKKRKWSVRKIINRVYAKIKESKKHLGEVVEYNNDKKYYYNKREINSNLIYLLNNYNFYNFLKHISSDCFSAIITNRLLKSKLYPFVQQCDPQCKGDSSIFLKNLILSNNLKRNIFKKVKYKLIKGMKIDINGRLTKRYRADRSRRYYISRGCIGNIYAKENLNLNYSKYRGYRFSNVIYSTSVGKVRIGSFGIKGWIGCW